MEKESLMVIAVVALVAVVGMVVMQNQEVSGATGNAISIPRNFIPQFCRQIICRTDSVEQYYPVGLHNNQILNITRNRSRYLVTIPPLNESR